MVPVPGTGTWPWPGSICFETFVVVVGFFELTNYYIYNYKMYEHVYVSILITVIRKFSRILFKNILSTQL